MSTSDQAAIGTEVGPYRLVAVVGQGGMSAVYRAIHVTTGDVCALKLMRAVYAGDSAFRERFVREGSYASVVQNEHIVPVLGSGEYQDSLYLVMRYVEGTDLRRVLDRERRLDPARAIRILAEIAEALDAVHAAGMVHRDVKPGNILLDATREEWAFLTDFGLTKNPAKDAFALTAAGTFVGTIDYTPPEQILVKELAPTVDVYALACVLFEALTGKPPFAGRRDLDILQAHIYETAPTISSAGGPAALDALLASALAKEPSERPQTCGALIAAAADALGVGATRVDNSQVVTLRVLEGPAEGSLLTFPETGELRIGRIAEPPANLGGDTGLSRVHARLFVEDGAVTVEDLGSTNGTFIGDERVTGTRPFAAGVRLHMGSSVLELISVLEPPEREPAEAPVDGQVEAPGADAPPDATEIAEPEIAPIPELARPVAKAGPEIPLEAEEPSERRISIRLDLDLGEGETTLVVEPVAGVTVSRQPDGSWRVELSA